MNKFRCVWLQLGQTHVRGALVQRGHSQAMDNYLYKYQNLKLYDWVSQRDFN